MPILRVKSKLPIVNNTSGKAGTTKYLTMMTPIIAGRPNTIAVLQSTYPFKCCFKPPIKALAPTMNKERKGSPKKENDGVNYNYPLILLEGLIVGAITGLIGAGGGFLIIPALVLLANVEMKVAIGTSLVIIAFKSLLGFFLGDALTIEIDWQFLAIFTGLSFVGIFIGSYLGNFIDGQKLKKGFGYFIFVMAIFIFYMEFVVNQ